MLKPLFARFSTLSSSVGRLLRFVLESEHPKRGQIAAAYLRLRVRDALSRRTERQPRSFSLLGTRMHFGDARMFSFLFRELFIEESYRGCEQPPDTIVDCGSNIGMSILLFKSLWPKSRITGIEASPEMFRFLKENVKQLHGVTVMNKAVSYRRGQMAFYTNPSSLNSSTNALRSGGEEIFVEAAPLSDFIAGSVDLLKIDIEGSEMGAFAELEASGRLPLIRQMFIEYHHHLPGESHRLSSFLERLERGGFDYELAAALPRRSGGFQDVLIRAKRRA